MDWFTTPGGQRLENRATMHQKRDMRERFWTKLYMVKACEMDVL